MEKPSYYAIIPSSVRYDKSLKPFARLMYGEITCLTNKFGFCVAGNDYFASIYEVSTETVSRWVSQLKNAGYISVQIERNNNNKRKIFINKPCLKSQDLLIKKSRPLDEIVKTSIYSINNKLNNPESAVFYVINNYPIRFETEFLMRYEKQFKSQDQFDEFLSDYNAEAEMKERVFGKWLMPMITKYVKNWLNHRNNNQGNSDFVEKLPKNWS